MDFFCYITHSPPPVFNPQNLCFFIYTQTLPPLARHWVCLFILVHPVPLPQSVPSHMRWRHTGAETNGLFLVPGKICTFTRWDSGTSNHLRISTRSLKLQLQNHSYRQQDSSVLCPLWQVRKIEMMNRRKGGEGKKRVDRMEERGKICYFSHKLFIPDPHSQVVVEYLYTMWSCVAVINAIKSWTANR